MAAATFMEMNSFLGKFSQLSTFGFNASLTFKSHDGIITAKLEAELGSHYSPKPSSNQVSSKSQLLKKTKPSRVRRRNFRKVAQSEKSSSEILESDNLSSENLISDESRTDEVIDNSNSYRSVGDILDQVDGTSPEHCIDFDQGSHILVAENDHNHSASFISSKNATDDIQDLNSANETSQPLSNPTPKDTPFSLPVNQNEFYQIMEDFRRSLDTSLEQTLSASLSKLT